MGILSDIYIATPTDAISYDKKPELPDSERAQFTRITPLEVSTLWAILQDKKWDVSEMGAFECILDEEERWISSFPSEMVSVAANLDEKAIVAAAERWAKTDEIACKPSEIQPVIESIVRLARSARASGKSLYLWNCL